MSPREDPHQPPVPVRDANDVAGLQAAQAAQAQGVQAQAPPPVDEPAVQAAVPMNLELQEVVEEMQEIQERVVEDVAAMARQQQDQAARIAAAEAAHLDLLARLDAQIARFNIDHEGI